MGGFKKFFDNIFKDNDTDYDGGGVEDGYTVGDNGYDDGQEPEIEEESLNPRNNYNAGYAKRNNNSKVVNIHTNVQMEVVVATPESLAEAGEVCDDLKAKKTVIVNLEKVDHDIAQRISDFLCGACYALEGSIQLISEDILIIGPINVDITGEFKEVVTRASGMRFPYTGVLK